MQARLEFVLAAIGSAVFIVIVIVIVVVVVLRYVTAVAVHASIPFRGIFNRDDHSSFLA